MNEVIKAESVVNALIQAVKRSEEGKCEVDVLGCLYVIQDQLTKLDVLLEV